MSERSSNLGIFPSSVAQKICSLDARAHVWHRTQQISAEIYVHTVNKVYLLYSCDGKWTSIRKFLDLCINITLIKGRWHQWRYNSCVSGTQAIFFWPFSAICLTVFLLKIRLGTFTIKLYDKEDKESARSKMEIWECIYPLKKGRKKGKERERGTEG